MADICLFKDRRSAYSFRRASVGDVLNIKGEGTDISVLVCDRKDNSAIECPCVFNGYSALCANASCSRYAYKNLDNILENL